MLEYHQATKHSPASVRADRFELDWPNKPLAFKIYTSREPIELPLAFKPSSVPALLAIAGRFGDSGAAIAVLAGDPASPIAALPGSSRGAVAGLPGGSGGVIDRELLARLCYFSNGITRVIKRAGRSMPFRAAACTGALYHVELYVVCGDLPDLAAGVYHYAARDNSLRLLRPGDFRAALVSATGAEPSVGTAPMSLVYTSTYWRNAWKYRARAYRHVFWDTGTIVANLLSVAAANGVRARVLLGFADADVNRLLDIDPCEEAAVCIVTLNPNAATPTTAQPPVAPPTPPLNLATQPLSPTRVEYPEIIAAHTASSLATGAAAAAWRGAAPTQPSPVDAQSLAALAQASRFGRDTPVATGAAAENLANDDDRRAGSIEAVILRRGSSRRFARDAIGREQLVGMLAVATTQVASDFAGFGALTQPYLIVNAVQGLAAGAYAFNRDTQTLDLLKAGDFRREAAFLDLDQDLAGDAAVNAYWLADLAAITQRSGERAYRAAQLEAAVEGGKLYLAAYALGLGATGLTFYDDEVTRFFEPHATGKAVLFLVAVGRPARKT